MVTMTPREALGITEPVLEPEKALTTEQLHTLDASPETLAKNIRDGSATVDEVESFLQNRPKIPSKLKNLLMGFLLAKKAGLLLRENRAEEAFQCAEQALIHDDGSPVIWLAKGAALLRLERFEVAAHSFETAFSSRKRFGLQLDQYLPTLFKSWSGCALLHGLSGILRQDVATAQRGVAEYLRVLDAAKAEDLESALVAPIGRATEDSVPPELQAALEELELMVRLLSIKDPFDRWREFSKEISTVWPKDVSAIDAIREQRE